MGENLKLLVFPDVLGALLHRYEQAERGARTCHWILLLLLHLGLNEIKGQGEEGCKETSLSTWQDRGGLAVNLRKIWCEKRLRRSTIAHGRSKTYVCYAVSQPELGDSSALEFHSLGARKLMQNASLRTFLTARSFPKCFIQLGVVSLIEFS